MKTAKLLWFIDRLANRNYIDNILSLNLIYSIRNSLSRIHMNACRFVLCVDWTPQAQFFKLLLISVLAKKEDTAKPHAQKEKKEHNAFPFFDFFWLHACTLCRELSSVY